MTTMRRFDSFVSYKRDDDYPLMFGGYCKSIGLR